MKPFLTLAVLLVLTVSATADDFVPGKKVAFLGLGFVDFSTEGAYDGVRADQTERLALLEALIEERFRAEGLVLVDTAPVSKKLANIVNPAKCYGCDVRMAKTLGADFSLVGAVHKVSNLILSEQLILRDANTGDIVRAKSVGIRSNTDASWSHGMNYILKTTFFEE
ncbi:DUF3280 domain-containing protein [Roseibium sp. Sym1]|uniref:DUF3280 domain-containing protein n=1 Tax=Roseibium sp. Sym1 TaxID=3016006 RepID=UPI0022B2D255|nr:DUF3280 domain-containing protein [Roseibium sp. Sym1]